MYEMTEAMLCVSVSELKVHWDLRILLWSLGLGMILRLLPIFCLLQKVRVHNLSALTKKKKSGEKRKRERIVFSGSMKCSQRSSMSCRHNEAGSKLCQEPGKKPKGFKPTLLLNSPSHQTASIIICFLKRRLHYCYHLYRFNFVWFLLLLKYLWNLILNISCICVFCCSQREQLFFKIPAIIFAQESYLNMNLSDSEMVWLWALRQAVSPAKKFRKSCSKS